MSTQLQRTPRHRVVSRAFTRDATDLASGVHGTSAPAARPPRSWWADQVVLGEPLRGSVEDSLRDLPHLDERVLRALFGIGQPARDLPTLSQQFGVPHERMRLVVGRALRQLRAAAVGLGHDAASETGIRKR